MVHLYGAIGGFVLGVLVYLVGAALDWFWERRRRRAEPKEGPQRGA